MFNGEAKERLSVCRSCHAMRLDIPMRDEARAIALKVLRADVRSFNGYEGAAVRLAELVENGTRVLKEFKHE